MRSSFLPKSQPKITEISALEVYWKVGQKSYKLLLGILGKEWTGKTIYLNFSSIFGDFFLKYFEEEVSDFLS